MSGGKWTVVTGGAGFIGSHLAEALIREGRRVRIVDDFSTGHRANLPADAELVEGDVVENAEQTVRDAEVVYHLAALPSVPRSIAEPLKSHRSTAESTVAILAAGEKAGLRRLVIASSAAVYGDVALFPKREDQKPSPLSPYALAKLCGELYAEYWASRRSLETVTLRFFNVYGPRQDPDSAYAAAIPIFLRHLLREEPVPVFGDGTQTRDFIYVRDVVRGLMAAGTVSGVSGRVYNLAGGRAISVLTLVKILARIVETSPVIKFLPPRAGDIHDSWADVSAAQRDLGFVPQTSIEAGLRETVRWFQDASLV
jgi:UDP-glucose 4-epimerase